VGQEDSCLPESCKERMERGVWGIRKLHGGWREKKKNVGSIVVRPKRGEELWPKLQVRSRITLLMTKSSGA